MVVSVTELLKHIKLKLIQQLEKIEKRVNTVGKESRNRQDVIRCALYRTISKIPQWILMKLVSVGDRKHSDPARLLAAYEKASNGFLGIYKYLINMSSDDVVTPKYDSYANTPSYTLKFSAVHFPVGKVSEIANAFFEYDNNQSVQSLFIEKKNPSTKNIRELILNNEAVVHLIHFTKIIATQYGGFEKCLKALQDFI